MYSFRKCAAVQLTRPARVPSRQTHTIIHSFIHLFMHSLCPHTAHQYGPSIVRQILPGHPARSVKLNAETLQLPKKISGRTSAPSIHLCCLCKVAPPFPARRVHSLPAPAGQGDQPLTPSACKKPFGGSTAGWISDAPPNCSVSLLHCTYWWVGTGDHLRAINRKDDKNFFQKDERHRAAPSLLREGAPGRPEVWKEARGEKTTLPFLLLGWMFGGESEGKTERETQIPPLIPPSRAPFCTLSTAPLYSCGSSLFFPFQHFPRSGGGGGGGRTRGKKAERIQ
mmetsp:Transcript_31800/g.62976  ORF Transcript_31800/g.62976 Transcript_31800/m.62976 type:complete len:282 (-) Transcript_31800:428-1273(-)